jgi:hypothetical protein
LLLFDKDDYWPLYVDQTTADWVSTVFTRSSPANTLGLLTIFFDSWIKKKKLAHPGVYRI